MPTSDLQQRPIPPPDPALLPLAGCPACGSREARGLFPADCASDNDVGEGEARLLAQGLTPQDLALHRRSDFAACAGCGLIYARRRLTPEAAAPDYGRLLEIIEMRGYNRFPLPEDYCRGKQRSAAALLDALGPHLPLGPDSAVLHVRCAGGQLLDEIRRRAGGQALYGLEFFEGPRRHAREVLGLPHIAPLHLPEFENPFPRARFDVIFANHLLTHAHDPALVLARLDAALAPGGLIVLHNELDHERFLTRRPLGYKRGVNVFHKQLLSPATLALIVRRAGFAQRLLPQPASGHDAWMTCLAWRPGERPDPGCPAPAADPEHLRRLFGEWRRAQAGYERRRRRKTWLRRLLGPLQPGKGRL